MKKGEAKIGDIVRYTGSFLKSVGLVTAPLNGCVRDIEGAFTPDSEILVVEWSDCHGDPYHRVNCVNVELDPRHRGKGENGHALRD
jgi:hypothetical protein